MRYRGGVRALLIMGGLLIGYGSAQAQAPAGGPPALAQSIWEEIAVLQALNRLQFTSEQATAALKAVDTSLTELDGLRARQNRQSVREALWKARGLLLRGQTVPLELWQQMVPEGRVGMEREILAEDQYALANQAAEAFLTALKPDQIKILAEAEAYEQGERFLAEALEMRKSRAEDWDAWLAGMVDEAVATYAHDKPEQAKRLREKLPQVAQQVREAKDPPDAVASRRLVGELAAALATELERSDEEVRRQAQLNITDWFLQPGIRQLLGEVEKAERK
jgi:hypothetical protein